MIQSVLLCVSFVITKIFVLLLGDLDNLLKYETIRQRDVIPMMTAIDTLKRLFSTSFFPFVFARTLGLQATNAITPLKVNLHSY